MKYSEIDETLAHTEDDDRYFDSRLDKDYNLRACEHVGTIGNLEVVNRNYPYGKVYFFLHDGKPVGTAIVKRGGRTNNMEADWYGVTVIYLQKAYRQKGLGTEFYKLLISQGYKLKPDSMQTAGGEGMWKSLRRKGLTETENTITTWHSSNNTISNVIPFMHLGTQKAAKQRGGKNLYEFDLQIQKPLKINDAIGETHSVEGLTEYLETKLNLNTTVVDTILMACRKDQSKGIPKSLAGGKALATVLMRKGYDFLYYENQVEDLGSISWIVINPKHVIEITKNKTTDNLTESFLYPIGSKMPANIIDYRDPNKAEEKFITYDDKQLAYFNSEEYQNKFGKNREIPTGYNHKVPDTKIVLGHNNKVIVFFYSDNNIIPWKELLSIIDKAVDKNLQTDTLFGIEVKDNGYVIAQSRDTGQWTGDRTKYSFDLKHIVQTMIDRGIAIDKTPIWIGTYKNPTLIGAAGNIVKTPDIPSKITVYHGTSSYRWHHIQKTGLKALPIEERVWNKGALEKERPEHREDSIYLTASMDQATYYAKKAVNVDRKRYGPTKRRDASNLTNRLEIAIQTAKYDLEQAIKNPDEVVKDRFDYNHGKKRLPAKYYEEMIAKWKEQIEKLVPMKDYYGDMKPVILEITLGKSDYKNLMADDDYLAKKYNDMTEKNQHAKDWRESLSDFGQIAFKGTIPPSRIKAL